MFWTTWVLVGILGVLIVWDVVLAFWDSERPNTWSEVARAASHRLPILPWCLGALVGHLFHGSRIPVIDRDAGATLMGTLTLLVIGWSAVLYLTGGVLSILSVTGTFGVGTLVGHSFHPWSDSGPMGNDFPGLGVVLAIAVLLSVVTWVFDRHISGKKWVVGLALLGLVAGVVLWPVSA